jgi:hypothetical protein
MAESSNSNSEGQLIGARRFAVPRGFKLEKAPSVAAKVVFRAQAPVAPKPAAVVRPAVAATVGARLVSARPAPKPAVAEEKKEGEEGEEGGEGVAAAPLPATVEVADSEEQAEAVAEVAAVKQPERSVRVQHIFAPPADAPMITPEEFNAGAEGEAIKEVLGAAVDAEVKPEAKEFAEGQAGPAYRPITSGEFQDFIVQTYRQYADTTGAIMNPATRKLERAERELDKDACKRRDPNKVETFHYQKFVRDYLSRDTPYRGMLVYHGLGTGKTCTSIAAAEALYWGGRKTIWILTPATLSSNYRREIAKCGYFPLRYMNYWQFLECKPDEATGAQPPQFEWLHNVLGLPEALITKQGGGWVPDPNRSPNWPALSDAVKQSIRDQVAVHLQFRFKFVHYNGVRPATLAQMAFDAMEQRTSPFDDAVIIIDEIHNLARTINGTQIGAKPISRFIAEEEPVDYNWTMPESRGLEGGLRGKFRYPRGYTFYRLLQNAVNAKIIALSATPMINYAQEFGILMNIVGGEQRTVEISLEGIDRTPGTAKRITDWARQHPEIDFFAIEEDLSARGKNILTVSPVPHGFVKVVDPTANYALRGFVRRLPEDIRAASTSNERNMDGWAARLVQELESAGVFPAGAGAEVTGAVTASRAAGIGAPLATERVKLKTYQLLPDNPQNFVDTFINRATLAIEKPNILKARASGLISYYKGGSEELMPRIPAPGVPTLVEVPMSDYMFSQYIKVRQIELDQETKPTATQAGGPGGGKAVGAKAAAKAKEADLYAQATKSQQTGFLALSRAACNFVFPEDVPRPVLNAKQQAKLLGIQPEGVVAADLHEDVDAELNVPPRGVASAVAASGMGAAPEAGEEGGEAPPAALADDPEAAAAVVEAPIDASLEGIIGSLMTQIDANAGEYLNTGLMTLSPKYAEMIGRIRASPGPALVYSQFKTLEGLGLFAAALRASDEKYLPLDIVKDAASGQWKIPDVLMTEESLAQPRYILYTGDQDLEKRRLLLQLYNADVAGLPPILSEQCKTLLAGEPDNREGRVCRVFMITQSGAEGISLFNTRQVHIMEPYWNNVRLQQVIGRAIRLCSHMNLPWDDRLVEVFIYLSVFTPEQKSGSSGKTVMTADKGKTTDQMIYDIAVVKQKLADGLFDIAQSAATDCKIHYVEQGIAAKVVCFEFAKGARPMFLYHPDLRRDLGGVGGGGGGGASAATGAGR